MAIDLDGFKQVNDVYSHSTGDQVLVAVARTVTERVRIDALVARRGGDEFVVVLEDADPQVRGCGRAAHRRSDRPRTQTHLPRSTTNRQRRVRAMATRRNR